MRYGKKMCAWMVSVAMLLVLAVGNGSQAATNTEKEETV